MHQHRLLDSVFDADYDSGIQSCFWTLCLGEKFELPWKNDESWHLFSFRGFSVQNLTFLKGQLHREIEQVLLYRMVYATKSMNLDFAPNRLPIPSDKPFSRSYWFMRRSMKDSIIIVFLIEFWMRYTNQFSVLKNELVWLSNDKNIEKVEFFENIVWKVFLWFLHYFSIKSIMFVDQNDQRKLLNKSSNFHQIWIWSMLKLEKAGGITLILS